MSELAVGRPMEILLVEDSLIDARITMEALQQSGVKHRLTLIRDGDECLQSAVEEQQVDVVHLKTLQRLFATLHQVLAAQAMLGRL